MHSCPVCGGNLQAVEEGYSEEYACSRCGEIFTEDELQLGEEEDSDYNSI